MSRAHVKLVKQPNGESSLETRDGFIIKGNFTTKKAQDKNFKKLTHHNTITEMRKHPPSLLELAYEANKYAKPTKKGENEYKVKSGLPKGLIGGDLHLESVRNKIKEDVHDQYWERSMAARNSMPNFAYTYPEHTSEKKRVSVTDENDATEKMKKKQKRAKMLIKSALKKARNKL